MRISKALVVLSLLMVCALSRSARADDAAVLQHCHELNRMEIDAGKLAYVRGTLKVQRYARRVVKDHAIADKQIQAIAEARGVVLVDHAGDVDQELHEDLMAKLVQLHDDAFDDVYLMAMIAGHDAMAAYLAGAIDSAVLDEELRAYLKTLKPIVEKHARLGRRLHGEEP